MRELACYRSWFDSRLVGFLPRLKPWASSLHLCELSHRDAMIAATARSTGDEYVVADSDFETTPLEDVMTVTNLHADR